MKQLSRASAAGTLLPDDAAADTPDLESPTHDAHFLLGRYIVIDVIGRGGMGEVLRAYDPKLLREVALKRVRTGGLSTQAHARLVQEARSMAQLSHEHIVTVYDVEILDDDVVMVMELVRGITLKAWLSQSHTPRDIIAMFCAAGRGLAAAHAAGMLHRDFKPTNVLVGEDGRARVTDFGLARSSSGTDRGVTEDDMPASSDFGGAGTSATDTMGTPRYMAPEQHLGQPLDPSADQYAFCVALWEALTGQRAFPDPQSKRCGPPSWPQSVAVSATVRNALARGLAVAPEERWPSMDALLVALIDATHRRRRSHLRLGLAAGVAGLGTLALTAYHRQVAQRCSGGEAALSEVWSAERADAVAHAFAVTGAAYAPAAWNQLAPELERYATAWVAMHRDACEATTVRGEQPPEVMDLRMACLQRAKVDLRAVTQLLARADAQVVEKAHALVGSLPGLDRCADVDALQAQTPPPEPAHADEVQTIRAELAEIKALREAAKYPETLALSRTLAERALAVPYPPVQTEVLVELGYALDSAGSYTESEAVFKRALRSALAFRQWDAAMTSASRLVFSLGWQQIRPVEALAYAETAKGLLPWVHPSAEADLRSYIGSTLHMYGRLEEALEESRAAVAVAQRVWGPEHVNVATYRGNLGVTLTSVARYAEAEAEMRAKLALDLEAFPPDHPTVAHSRRTLGRTLELLGRYDEAEEQHRKAIAAYTAAFGPDHLETVESRSALALVLARQGRHQQSHAEYVEVLRLQRQIYGGVHFNVLLSLCGAIIPTLALGEYVEAESMARESVEIATKLFGPVGSDTAVQQSNVAQSLIYQERYEEAEREARKAIAGFQSEAPRVHPSSSLAHSHLSHALHARGRFVEAEREIRTALALATRLWGDDDPSVASARMSLGSTLEAQGRAVEAEAEQRKALDIVSKRFPPEHPQVALARGLVARALLAQQRYEEAQAEYVVALASLRSSARADALDAAELHAGYGDTLLARNRSREALELLEEAWQRWGEDARVPKRLRGKMALSLARALRATRGDAHRIRRLGEQGRLLLGR